MNSPRTLPSGLWADTLPSVIRAIGTEQFAPALDSALRAVAGFDISCIFSYTLQARPRLLHDGLNHVSTSAVMANYLNGTYLLDAVYDACRRDMPTGLYRLSALAPDQFFEGEYYNSPEFHPCISMETGALSEEIVFFTRIHDSYIAYSLMRQQAHPLFSEQEFAALQTTATTVIALMESQWRGRFPVSGSAENEDPKDTQLSQAMDTFGGDVLTARERLIATMILRGHSTVSIAANLGLSEGTVKNHRKHIYAKLQVYSQSGLFSLFIQHIFD
ncbi:LuxR C-terminal-related transcriptional regulator [Castellaniella sp. FW104-16D08]|uniref:response regulator transcription factor n=1 Tax=unclassified Castellaniella TaxID=2617606 RepID=UPI003315297D